MVSITFLAGREQWWSAACTAQEAMGRILAFRDASRKTGGVAPSPPCAPTDGAASAGLALALAMATMRSDKSPNGHAHLAKRGASHLEVAPPPLVHVLLARQVNKTLVIGAR